MLLYLSASPFLSLSLSLFASLSPSLSHSFSLSLPLSLSLSDGIKSQKTRSPQHPVTWQPSKEGDHLIGRITLTKRTAMPKEAGAMLGLKVSHQSLLTLQLHPVTRRPGQSHAIVLGASQ